LCAGLRGSGIDWIKAVQQRDQAKGVRNRRFTPDAKLRVPQGTKRLLASTFYQIKLGHGYLKDYLKRIGRARDDRCTCGTRETVDHILFSCRNTTSARREQGLIANSKSILLNIRVGIERVLSFLQTTGVATRRRHLERTQREEEYEANQEQGLGLGLALESEEGPESDVILYLLFIYSF
jgi:hypothetical protein